MSDNRHSTLLVTGASGHFGRRVLELLREAGANNVIATTRTPDKLADFSAQGVVVRYADFEDPVSLAGAFAGADRMLLLSTDVAAQGMRRFMQHINAVKAANDAGVKHVLYTSITNPDDTPVALAPDHRGTEAALGSSGMGWTILRNNIYTDTLVQTLTQAAQIGALYSAAGDGRTAYITREDCTRAAVAALLDSFDGRRILDITGAEAVSYADLARIASDITGKNIPYIPLEPGVMTDNLTRVGLPLPVAELVVSFARGTAEGKLDLVTNTYEELTGRKPERAADFLAAHLTA